MAASFMSRNDNLTLLMISETVSTLPCAKAPLVVGTCGVPACTPTPVVAVAPIKSYITSSHPPSAEHSGAVGLVTTGCASSAGGPLRWSSLTNCSSMLDGCTRGYKGLRTTDRAPRALGAASGVEVNPHSDDAGMAARAGSATPANIAPHRPTKEPSWAASTCPT